MRNYLSMCAPPSRPGQPQAPRRYLMSFVYCVLCSGNSDAFVAMADRCA
jgi:hypothetical protein